jgi:hypothetical protein
VNGDNGNGHLTLKRQWELMRAIEKGKRKGYWDQEAADTLGNYMLDNEIRRLTLRGYAAEISDAGLFVEEASFKRYGLTAYLHIEYGDSRHVTAAPHHCGKPGDSSRRT